MSSYLYAPSNIIWLCDCVRWFQSKPHISPLLTIESPVAQCFASISLDHRGSWVQIASGTQIFLGVDTISTYNNQCKEEIKINKIMSKRVRERTKIIHVHVYCIQ